MSAFIQSHLTLRSFLRLLFIAVVVSLFLYYTFFQSRLLIQGPIIRLTEEPAVIQAEPTVQIQGMVENVVTIQLNGRSIFVDEQGHFSEVLVLENGYTIMTINAKDRYGRATTITRPFVHTQGVGT